LVGVPSQSILEHRTEGPKGKWDHCQKEKKEKKKGKWKISTSSMSLWLHCSLALQLHVGLARLGLSLAGLLISIWNLHIILQSSTLRLEIVKYLYLLLNKILRAFTYHFQSFLFLVLGWLTFSTYRAQLSCEIWSIRLFLDITCSRPCPWRYCRSEWYVESFN